MESAVDESDEAYQVEALENPRFKEPDAAEENPRFQDRNAIAENTRFGDLDDVDEEEIEELEREVKDMAQKVQSCRTILPRLFKEALNSCQVAKRPAIPYTVTAEAPVIGGELAHSSNVVEDPAFAEKIELLKHKVSANVSTIHDVRKRVNHCLATMDKHERYSWNIHCCFKRKKTMTETTLPLKL